MTPETPPTPKNVAEMLTDGDGVYHDGKLWHVSMGADGNVVDIKVTPGDQDGNEYDEVHFRAVVVQGQTSPIVLPRPDAGETLRGLVEGSMVRVPATSRGYLLPAEARERAAELAAAADLAEQAEAQGGAR